MRCKILQLLILLLLLSFPATSVAVIDAVHFGDQADETAHQAQTLGTASAIGGCQTPCRYIQSGHKLSFRLNCDPEAPNFLTVKFWGSDHLGRKISLPDASPPIIDAPLIEVHVRNRKITPDHRWVTLLAEPSLPGRFYYETFQIPRELTQGHNTLEIALGPAPHYGGQYATVGGPQPTEIPQDVFSQGVYAAYLHTENFFAPAASEPQGRKPDFQPAPAEPVSQARPFLTQQIDNGTAELMSRQLYGPDWQKAAHDFNIPAYLTGLFHWQGLDTYLQNGRGKPGDDDYWKIETTGSANGRGHAGAMAMFMRAYHNPLSRFHQNPELLDRALKGLDAYCVYQGENGALEIGGGASGWIGGPHRKTAGGGLPGFFAAGLADSFLQLWTVLKDRPQLQDELIDNHGDGLKTVPRKEAYRQLFANYLTDRLHQRGGVPNQDIANCIGAWLCNQSLQLLSPDDAVDWQILLNFAEEASSVKIARVHHQPRWWFSPQGISLEGGYTPSYGQQPEPLGILCQLTDHPGIAQRLHAHCDAWANFFYPVYDNNRPVLRAESPIGARHRPFVGKVAQWQEFLYPALDLKNPAAARIVSFALQNQSGELYHIKLDASARMHLVFLMQSAYRLYENLDRLAALDDTGFRLPTEKPQPCLWFDSMAKVVMLKTDRDLLYFAFDINNRGENRVHHLTDHWESFGDLAAANSGSLHTCRYGPFLIVMNSLNSFLTDEQPQTHTFHFPDHLRSAVSLIDNLPFIDKTLKIPPGRTFVFTIRNKSNQDSHRHKDLMLTSAEHLFSRSLTTTP